MEDKKNCGNCHFWENRPEGAMDTNTGYCRKRDAMKGRKSNCTKFEKKRFGHSKMPPDIFYGLDDDFLDIQDA